MSHLVSIVAIFKNEHQYIKEWLEYHLKVGVEHFYLYDNGDDHWNLIEPYKGKVTYHIWTDEKALEFTSAQTQKLSRQTGAYTHCLQNYGQETRCLQLIDLDEFIVPLDGNQIPVCIDESVAVQRIPRINFGNSGYWKSAKEGGSISAYFRRERKPSHHKDMGNPDLVKKIKGPHTFITDGKIEVSQTLSIHHHYSRTLEEWLERAQTGGGQKGMGFRVFIGKRKWLAYLSYLFLNARSLHVFLFMIGLNLVLVSATPENYYPYLLNLPLIGWVCFAFLRGQNEVKDSKLQELWNS